MTLSAMDASIDNDFEGTLLKSLHEMATEDGASIVLLQRNGQIWSGATAPRVMPSLSREEWQAIVMRLDDGDDPLITQIGDCSFVVASLYKPLARCHFAAVVLPKKSMEQVLRRFDLIQIVLGQLNLLSTRMEPSVL